MEGTPTAVTILSRDWELKTATERNSVAWALPRLLLVANSIFPWFEEDDIYKLFKLHSFPSKEFHNLTLTFQPQHSNTHTHRQSQTQSPLTQNSKIAKAPSSVHNQIKTTPLESMWEKLILTLYSIPKPCKKYYLFTHTHSKN